MAKDAWAQVEEAEGDSADLYKRQEGDKDLLYLSKYKMQDRDGQNIEGIINITLNDPALFAANVLSGLGATKQQVVVETEDKKLDTAYIEDFQKAALNAANLRLRKAGRPPLSPFHDEQFCIRGRGADRCLFRVGEKGELIPDIIPLDTRYFTYEMGAKGMLWGGYKTSRKKSLIESEYGVIVKGKEGIVLDWWDSKKNEIWIDGDKKDEQPNPYGYPPFVLQVVSLGSMLQDKESLPHHGESIFFLIRDIIPELNRLASITQTLNMATFLGAKVIESADGKGLDVKELQAKGWDQLGGVIALEIGGRVSLVPVADIKRAAMLLHSMLESRLQRGSLTAIDLGNLTFPLSAVALVEIGEGRDQVFLPRLDAKALLQQSLAEMFTAQVIQIGGKVELGVKGQKRIFDTGKLKGEYETTYRFFPKTPTVDIARYSVAAAAERYLDTDTIITEVLQQEDPAEIRRKRYYDMAEQLSPLVMMRRVVESLIKQDKDEEARLVMSQAGLTLEQLMGGEVPAQPEPTRTAPQPVVPLLGEGGQVGGVTPSRRARQLMETPEGGE